MKPDSAKTQDEVVHLSGSRVVLFSVVSTVILLVILEISLRLLGVDPRQALVNPEGPYIRHETREWALKPGYARKWAGSFVEINDKGLRDRPLDYKKTREFRILLLGGSVTFGYGVEANKTYAFQLENWLGKERTQGQVRTINTGVGGYSTFQELQYLKEEGYRFSPDVVVLDFGLNDVLERYLILKKYGGTGVFRGGKMTEIDLNPAKTKTQALVNFVKNLPKKTAFYSVARKIKVLLIAKTRGEKEIQDQIWMARKVIQGEMNPKLQSWNQTFSEIEDWANFTRKIGAKPVLLIFPYRLQVEEGMATNKPQRMLEEFCQKAGLVYVDLAKTFHALPAEQLFLDEDHPTELGHEIAAKVLGEALVEEKIISVDRANSRPY